MCALARRIVKCGFTRFALLVLAGLPMVIGCGSGGDGGGGGGLSYTGLTTAATIDEGNARGIATAAYTGGSTGGPFGPLTIGGGPQAAPQPPPLVLSMALKAMSSRFRPSAASPQLLIGAAVSESETFDGACGGKASINIQSDDQSRSFTGGIDFDAFCQASSTTTGHVDLSGQFDPEHDDIGDIESLKMSFAHLKIALKAGSFTVDGEASLLLTGSSPTFTMNSLLQDDRTGKVFWVKDYDVTFTQGTSVGVAISGQFYHPDYGYVTLSTPTSLRINSGNAYPSSGVLLASGEGQTKARLTALSSSTFRIEADTNGNGDYDYNSGPFNWSDL